MATRELILPPGPYGAGVGSIDRTAWVAPTAVLTGDVSLGPGARVLHGAARGTSMREIMRRQSAAYGPENT